MARAARKDRRNEVTGAPPGRAALNVGAVRLITPTRDVRVKGNEVAGVRGIGAFLSQGEPAAHIGLEIVNNLLVDTRDWAMNLHASPGLRLINNTVWDGQSDVILAQDGTYRDRTRSAVVLNNIFQRLNAPVVSTQIEDTTSSDPATGAAPTTLSRVRRSTVRPDTACSVTSRC